MSSHCHTWADKEDNHCAGNSYEVGNNSLLKSDITISVSLLTCNLNSCMVIYTVINVDPYCRNIIFSKFKQTS